MRNSSSSSEDDHHYEEEEAPRLSFCDLPDLYSSSSDAGNDVESKYVSSYSKEEQDNFYFNFFTSGFTTPENILFCGKQLFTDVSNGDDQLKSATKKKKKAFHWMMPSSLFTRTKTMPKQQQEKKKQNMLVKSSGGWRVMMCGSMRVPKEMEMADIKTRQKRRHPGAKAFVAMFEDHEQQKLQRKKLGTRSTSVKYLIGGLVRSLSRKGSNFSSAGVPVAT